MEQDGSPTPDPAPSGWPRAVASVAVAVVAAVAIYVIVDKLVDRNQPFEIVVDRASGVTIKAQAGDGIEALIDRAFSTSAAAVGGVLAERGFYKLHSDNMITALALTDPGALPSSTLQRYRKLLGDLEGPFRRPGTLLESDERLLSAIEDLEAQVRETRVTNDLIAALWQQSVNQVGIFRPRLLKARIVLLAEADDAGSDPYTEIFTCPGSPIKNHLITVGAPNDGADNPLPATSDRLDGIVRDDPFMSRKLGCPEDGRQMLSALLFGEPMVLGLSFDSLARIVEVPQGSDEEIFAWVQVRGGPQG